MAAHGGSLLGGCPQRAECTPRESPLTPWGNPVGILSKRGGWELRGQPVPAPAPTQPGGGWEPRGQPPHPPALVQPNEDVGCLINTLAMGLQLGTPCINTFSGKATPGKMEVLFEQWYHKVQCVKDHYLESVVKESMIHSLKGQQQIWPDIWALLPA